MSSKQTSKYYKRIQRRIYLESASKQKFRDMVGMARIKAAQVKIDTIRRKESLLFLLIEQEQAGDKTLGKKIDSLTEEVSYTNATA